jgi:hypothetical protein
MGAIGENLYVPTPLDGNWPPSLGNQRANSIIDYLKSKMKNKNNIDAIGYGETTIDNNTHKNYLLIAGITRDEKISNSMMSKLSN